MAKRSSAAGRVLVGGWFSLDDGGATAGDVAALEVVCTWLEDLGRDYDVALAPLFGDGVHWRAVRPADYGTLVLVCGPVSPRLATWQLVRRFASCRLVALDVSLVDDPDAYMRFAAVVARDGSGDPQPDLAFVTSLARIPVVGVVRVHSQLEYGDRGRHVGVDRVIAEQLASRPLARVSIDTQLDANLGGLRNASEVAALIAKMDVVVTTRLHGLVFALRAGVPAAVIDPVAGGAKVAAQARAVGWPHVLTADGLDDEALFQLVDDCLEPAARSLALECVERARARIEDEVRPRFAASLESH